MTLRTHELDPPEDGESDAMLTESDVESPRAAVQTRTQRTRRSRIAFKSAGWSGSVETASALVVAFGAWLVVGAATRYPRWWELTLTIGVPILALLMLIVVQHTQRHANLATHLKLDELIRASDLATNHMITVEDASGPDLARIHAEFVETTDFAPPAPRTDEPAV